MAFPCTICGVCCKNISHIEPLKKYNLGNGVCKYLDLTNNFCKIYENRPDICDVDKMFDIEYYKQYSKKEFYNINATICNKIQEINNSDSKYKIKIIK